MRKHAFLHIFKTKGADQPYDATKKADQDLCSSLPRW